MNSVIMYTIPVPTLRLIRSTLHCVHMGGEH